MADSSFITSPLSPEFSDVWSEPELLSSKGHNAIYVATRFGRRYVLKALAEPYRASTPYIEMLRKEFSIGVGLDHPDIVRLLDFGYMDAIGWYIQMEYVDGITLEQFLETKPSKSVRLKIIHQLIDALSFLHERQIIHRDIKPSNILITRNGSTVKLIDFGVSDTDDYVTFKQPAGSMAYIAPEQLAGKTIDNRADIFAFGRIMQLVFPHRYRHIVRRCTRNKPEQRYASCAHVARAIRNTDRLRIGLPVSLIMLLLVCAAIGMVYSGYRQSERIHFDQESKLSASIDSLSVLNSILNDRHQATVDSLNRVVDSLIIKASTPSPREVVRQKAAALHQAHRAAIRKDVKNGIIKTQKDLSAYDSGLLKNMEETKRSISDPILREEFMEAYFLYFNIDRQLYDSLQQVLPLQ